MAEFRPSTSFQPGEVVANDADTLLEALKNTKQTPVQPSAPTTMEPASEEFQRLLRKPPTSGSPELLDHVLHNTANPPAPQTAGTPPAKPADLLNQTIKETEHQAEQRAREEAARVAEQEAAKRAAVVTGGQVAKRGMIGAGLAGLGAAAVSLPADVLSIVVTPTNNTPGDAKELAPLTVMDYLSRHEPDGKLKTLVGQSPELAKYVDSVKHNAPDSDAKLAAVPDDVLHQLLQIRYEGQSATPAPQTQVAPAAVAATAGAAAAATPQARAPGVAVPPPAAAAPQTAVLAPPVTGLDTQHAPPPPPGGPNGGEKPKVGFPIPAGDRRRHDMLKGYFNFDESTLTAEAKQAAKEDAAIIKEMVAADPNAKFEVRGHTDTMGGDAYNQNLSERRADAYSQALIENGVSESSLVAKGVGTADQEVTTGHGVNKKENRRVTIVQVDGQAADPSRQASGTPGQPTAGTDKPTEVTRIMDRLGVDQRQRAAVGAHYGDLTDEARHAYVTSLDNVPGQVNGVIPKGDKRDAAIREARDAAVNAGSTISNMGEGVPVPNMQPKNTTDPIDAAVAEAAKPLPAATAQARTGGRPAPAQHASSTP